MTVTLALVKYLVSLLMIYLRSRIVCESTSERSVDRDLPLLIEAVAASAIILEPSLARGCEALRLFHRSQL